METNGTLFGLDTATAMEILTADKIIMQKISILEERNAAETHYVLNSTLI